MPFFPPEQIELILKGLKARLTDAQASHYITLVANTLSQFPAPEQEGKMGAGEGFLNDEQSGVLCEVQYVADDDLYGSDGFISRLIDIYNSNQALDQRSGVQPEENVQSIKNQIFDRFLKQYEEKAWRDNQRYHERFNEFRETFRIFFAAHWRYASIHLPYPWIADALFETLSVFLKGNRINITQLGTKEFINPIVSKGLDIFFNVIGGKDRIPGFEPLLDEEKQKISEEQKREIIWGFQARITGYLIDRTLPALKESQEKAAIKMGINIGKSSLDVGQTEWLPDTVIDAILQNFLHKHKLSEVSGYYVAKASAVYKESLLKQELKNAFPNPLANSQAYFPIDTGGHWLFFKITQTFVDEKRQFHVLQIDSMGGDSKATATVCRELESLFDFPVVKEETVGTKEQSGVDGYTCGDRTMTRLINTLLTDLRQAFPENESYRNVTNPWQGTNPDDPQSIRQVTLQRLDEIKPKPPVRPPVASQIKPPTGTASWKDADANKKKEKSEFDGTAARILLCLVALFLVGCLITGGFGIGVLAGSVIAAQVFTVVFGAATVTAGWIGIAVGFFGGLVLFAMGAAMVEEIEKAGVALRNGLSALLRLISSVINPSSRIEVTPPVAAQPQPEQPPVPLPTATPANQSTVVHPSVLTPGTNGPPKTIQDTKTPEQTDKNNTIQQ